MRSYDYMFSDFSKEWKAAFWLWLAALGLRILYYFLFPNEFIVGGDQIQNILLAREFANGNFYGFLDTYWSPLYPLLIGLVSVFTDSQVLPTLIVSLIAGSFAAPLTYFFVKQFYEQREAVIAGVLAVFYPHLTNASVFEPGTESIYFLCIVGALIFGWKALKENGLINYLLTGVLFGLAYLTRPEAIAYPFYFAALAVIKKIFETKSLTHTLSVRVFVLMLGFFILASPYILYLKGETGNWTVSAKAKANLASGILSDQDKEEKTEPVSTGKAVKAMAKEIPLSLIEIHKDLPHLLPIFLMIFVGVGLLGSPWNKERLAREAYLILFCLVTFVGYAATVVQTRYFYILLPIFFGWIALGITETEKRLMKSFRRRHSNQMLFFGRKNYLTGIFIVLIFLYVCPLNYFINDRDAPFEERDAGLWLKKNGKPAPLIYSAKFTPVFYADGEKIKSTLTNQDEILQLIKEKQVDYVITGERSVVRNQYLKGFAESLENNTDFELIYRKNEGTKREISIFQYKNKTPENTK